MTKTETAQTAATLTSIPLNRENEMVPVRRGRSLVPGLLTFVILLLFTVTLSLLRYDVILSEKKQQGMHAVTAVRNKLQQTLAYSLSAAKTISFFIDSTGRVNNFDSVAAEILHSNNYIDALQLLPEGVVKFTYPLKGYEASLNKNILQDSQVNREAFQAIARNEFFFAGPMQEPDGEKVVTARLPIYRKSRFWGFAAVLISIDNFLKDAGIDSTGSRGFYYQLSKFNPLTQKDEYFLPVRAAGKTYYDVSIKLPDGEWKLQATPTDAAKGFGDVIILAILGTLLSLLGGYFVYSILKKPQVLNELVRKRTRQLEASEESYRELFRKSPLPLWIIDPVEQRFLEVSEAATRLYGYERDSFLQLNPQTIWPSISGDEKSIINIREINSSKSPAWVHLKKDGTEIRVMTFFSDIIYNGKPARLILVMDVTEKVAIEQALVKSEEKYRSLIEQATDGIILYSLDGTIHEFNKGAWQLTGYTAGEFRLLRLQDLLENGQVIINEENVRKLQQGINITFNRRVRCKNGSLLEAELNAKMMPDKKVIAIVRDITNRIKNEQEIRNMNQQLRQLSVHLENIREEERTNIAREIHDELGQQLTGLKMDLFWLNRKMNTDNPEVTERMGSALQLIDQTIKTVRKIATDLRPSILDDLGMIAALEWQSHEFAKRSDIKVNFVNNIGDLYIQPRVATALFRIYQELLTNIARHANAGYVSVVIGITGDQLFFSVADNGKGFNPEEVKEGKTLGLMGIKERTLLIDGAYDITTRPGEGTKVLITVPLQEAIAKK